MEEDLKIYDVELLSFNNCFILKWHGNIAHGSLHFYKEKNRLKVQSDYRGDREFIKLVLDKFADKLKIVGW